MSIGNRLQATGLILVAATLAACFGGGAPLEPPRIDPDLLQRGARVFLDPRASGDGSRSCATCHPGGGTIPSLFLRDEEVPPATDGARSVPQLRGLWETAPYMWDGSIATLSAAIASMLEVEMRNGVLSPQDLAALEAYVLSIPRFDRHRVEEDGKPIEPATRSAHRGFEIFEDECSRCHPPPTYQRSKLKDLGTGGRFNPPSLRGLLESAPYAHDGRWPSLDAAVRAKLVILELELDERQIFELIAYLKLL